MRKLQCTHQITGVRGQTMVVMIATDWNLANAEYWDDSFCMYPECNNNVPDETVQFNLFGPGPIDDIDGVIVLGKRSERHCATHICHDGTTAASSSVLGHCNRFRCNCDDSFAKRHGS